MGASTQFRLLPGQIVLGSMFGIELYGAVDRSFYACMGIEIGWCLQPFNLTLIVDIVLGVVEIALVC